MSMTEINERTASAIKSSETSAPADFGDVRAEFKALLSGCGVYDRSQRAKIKLTGEDRVRWLNGMVTNNIRDLAVGRGVYAFLLNPQGRILADLYGYNAGDFLLVDTDRSQLEKVLSVFDKYIIMDDVEVADISGHVNAIGIAGPRCVEVLKAAGFQASELQALQFAEITWRNSSVTLMRDDNPLVESYELWTVPQHSKNLWQSLVSAGAMPAGATAIELLRIAAGVPRYGQDIRERDLPQETEQQRALNFSKGCYIGQEIVERIRSRGAVHRKFVGFEIEGPLPAPGSKVQAEGKDVGEITSAASLPADEGERKVALGYCRREVGGPGREVSIGEATARISQLPFTGIGSAS
jgi:folate-binding protein YgfZ